MVTIKDIAQEAGVSIMTVSRVINNVPSKVSDATRKRVLDIIQERGYIPNSSARSLSSRSSRLAALLVEGDYSSPYKSLMVGHICTCVQQHDYSPLLSLVHDYDYLNKQLRTWNVDGAIFLGMYDSDLKRIHANHSIPLVFTDAYPSFRQINNVGIDDEKGGWLAAKHLISYGHKHIAFVGRSPGDSFVIGSRFRGFKQALDEQGIALPPEHILDDFPKLTEENLRRICPPVTAIFAASDILAVNVIKILHCIGLNVPRDCSVIGFDNLYFSEFSDPPLTTINQDIVRKATLATELLFARIHDKNIPAQNITLDVQLIQRDSVARPKED